MTKLRSKVLSMILVLALVFTSTGVVFGAETGLQKVPVQEKAAEADAAALNAGDEVIVEQEAVDKGEKLNIGTSTTAATINATTILNSKTTKSKKTYIISPDSRVVIPVKAKSTGMMYLDAKNVNGNTDDTISVYLCDTLSDATANNGRSYEWHYLDGGESAIGDERMPVTKGRTYYISIESESYNNYPASISVTPYVYTTGQRTLSQGTSKWTIVSGATAGTSATTTWFKIKPDRTGQMTVTLSEFDSRYASSGKVRLYNSKKKALSNEVYYYSGDSADRVYFGVKKGTTYYLKVTNCTGWSSKQYKYGIKYSVKKKTDRNLAAKSKAKTLKRKAKATESLFVASTKSSTDWYKIRVTSKRETVIYVDTTGIKSGKVTITAYKGSKRIGQRYVIYPNNIYGNKEELSLTYSTTRGKANAGTYYFKVVKSTKASGSYKIRYKR